MNDSARLPCPMCSRARAMDTAPEDEAVILFTTGDWVGEACMLRAEGTGEPIWKWADGRRVHPGFELLGWMPMPEPSTALASTDTRGQAAAGVVGPSIQGRKRYFIYCGDGLCTCQNRELTPEESRYVMGALLSSTSEVATPTPADPKTPDAGAANDWRLIAEARHDCTLYELMVPTPDGSGLRDAVTSLTIGSNNGDHDGEDRWTYVGWDWDGDQFVHKDTAEGDPMPTHFREMRPDPDGHPASEPDPASDKTRLSLSGDPMPPDGIEGCAAGGIPFKPGDMVIHDITEGTMHRACVGDERESFVDPETEEPIGPDEPLPTGYPWQPDAVKAGEDEPEADLPRLDRIERQMLQHGGVDSGDMKWMAAMTRTAITPAATGGSDRLFDDLEHDAKMLYGSRGLREDEHDEAYAELKKTIAALRAAQPATGGSVGDGGLREADASNLRDILTGVNKLLGSNATLETPEQHVQWLVWGLQGLKSRVDHAIASLAQPAPVGEDETGVREALKALCDLIPEGVLAGLQAPGDDKWLGRLFGAQRQALKVLAPQPPKAETPAGVGEVKAIANVIRHAFRIGASYTEGDAADAAASAVLAALSLAPTARAGDGVALADVAAERRRQIEVEGWAPEHDDEHEAAEMADAAACYAANASGMVWADEAPSFWPWSPESWKPTNSRRDLVKAGALILAEIERLDRAALTAAPAADGEDA